MSAQHSTSSGSGPKPASPGSRTIRFTIRRQDGPGKPARWETFNVPVQSSGAGSGSANVISCLQWIAANPTTTEGRTSTPVVFDCGCLEEVCGACTMVINGRVRQACSCLMDDYAPNDGDEIRLEPMSKFPVVRDLFVDRRRFFDTLRRVQAWVPIDGTYDLGAGPTESPDDQQDRYRLSTCMTCGCCLEACPQYTLEEDPDKWETSFVGAAVISQVQYFNSHRTGATLAKKRLDELSKKGGVSDCGNAQNCVRVCPKEIPLTESIGKVGRAVTVHNIRRFFSGS
ncbi:MAG: succinate dehydrogenase iron-sulfur subunit [Phycisphaerales bacterium]|nr:succinate dehydrogenase iron-sulfur subunit [Phycisphaerales bacterium]